MSDVDSIYNKPLILQNNIDTDNAPFYPLIEQQERVPKCLTIQTKQSINEDDGLDILSPDNLIEVNTLTELNSGDNKYLVLNEQGHIKFSKNLEGEMIRFTYTGDGAIYMSADRIWTKLDNNGNVIETIQSDMQTVRDGMELFKNATDLVALDTDIKLDIENAKNIESQVNNSIVLATQANNTLKTTTDNAKTEDSTLNASIDTAKVTDTNLNATNTTANNTNTTLNGTITTGNQLNSDLTTLNTSALETKGLLDTSKTNADASKVALDTSKSNADVSKTALDGSISSGNTLKTNLDNDISTGNTLKSGLETDITSGNTLKTNLETTITNANTAKTNLDNSISTGNTLKSGLETDINNANTARDNLNSAIASSDVAGMKANIDGIIAGTKDITYSSLLTINKTAKGAIAELLTYIGTIANLTTIDKTNLVNALNELNQAGQIAFFARNTPPTGWLKCNGALISRTSYSRLYSSIGVVFGSGDGSTTFALPDLRGEFIKGWDDGRGIDSGRLFGSWQGNQATISKYDTAGFGLINGANGFTDRVYINTVYGDNAHPRNIALLPCIKY